MAERIGWDKYEVALLIEVCEKVNNGKTTRSEAVKEVSANLRKRAIKQGRVIDDIFRNENGIGMQFSIMSALLKDVDSGLHKASKLFSEMALLRKTNPAEFDKILCDARLQIADERTAPKSMGNNKDEFYTWLQKQENIKLSPDKIIAVIDECSKYAMNHGISKKTFWEIDDEKVFVSVSSHLLSQRIFRLMHKSAALDMDKCRSYYKTFLREKMQGPETRSNVANEEKSETSVVEAQLLDGISVSDKLYLTLKDISDNNKFGTTLEFLAREAGVDIRAAKLILANSKWARLEYGRYHFNYEANNGQFTYDFKSPQSLAFTKPLSISYFGDVVSTADSWRQMFVDFMGTLYEDYPQRIEDIAKKNIGSSSIPLIANETNVSKMRVPKAFAEGYYLETNRSAADIMANLKRILDICCVDYENVEVVYMTKDTVQQTSKTPIADTNTSNVNTPIENADNSGISEIKQKENDIYSRLYMSSKVYDDPEGLSVSQLCQIVGRDEPEKIVALLDKVSWATKIGENRYSFAKQSAISHEAIHKPDDFNKERFIETLMRRYRNGMTFDSIDFDIFREMYDSLYDEEITFNDSELEERLKTCGVIYKDRLFPAEGIIDSDTKEKLFTYIENSFSSGKTVLYYKAILEDLADVFENCFTLTDEDMLKSYIEFTAEKRKYYFFKNYMSIERNVEIDHSAEIADYLLSAGKPMSKDEVCTALSHIPQDKVNQIITVDKRFLRNAKGEYFHTDIFEISASELEKIAEYINELIDENEYAIWTDVWNKLQDEMTVFLENNLYLSSLGVRNAIAQRYTNQFHFNGAVISKIENDYEMRDVYQLYAKHHDTFTADDIYNLSKELDTVIYFEALSEISVRVSHDLFVSKKQVVFDIDAVDKAISTFFTEDCICLREIDSFLAFPGIGYEWNEYLLESFLFSYSKKFVLLNNGFSLNNVAGAVAKRDGTIKEFADVCAIVLAQSDAELKNAEALDYLAEVNMITRRSYKDIDIVLQKAWRIRGRKG